MYFLKFNDMTIKEHKIKSVTLVTESGRKLKDLDVETIWQNRPVEESLRGLFKVLQSYRRTDKDPFVRMEDVVVIYKRIDL